MWKAALLTAVAALMAAFRVVTVQADEQPGSPAATDTSAKVRRSMARGAEFLKSKQQEDGTWQYAPQAGDNLNEATTALVVLALFSADPKADVAPVKKALERLERSTIGFTYGVALETAVFARQGPGRDLNVVRRGVEWLEKGQVQEGPALGSWSYNLTPGTRGDGSCSRFAVLALAAAEDAGVPVARKTWEKVRTYWTSSQNADGSWGYQPEVPGSLTMTCAGIGSLAQAEARLRADDAERPEPGREIQGALKFLATKLPGREDLAHAPIYLLHTLSVAGIAARQKRIADRDWRVELDDVLLAAQDADSGAWKSWGAGENEPVVATSLALLVLAR